MTISQTGFTSEYSEDEPALAEVAALKGDAILEFGAPWCGHCQRAAAAIKTVFNEEGVKTHIKVYDGKGKPLGRAFGVKLWPTLILLRDGKEVARVIRPTNNDNVRELFLS